jgi:glycosyltransferase involved in cell wall biosynthesis
MKVLFTVSYPLSWAKGGFTVQVENTKRELEALGIEVEWVDFSGASSPQGDILHCWGPVFSDVMWRSAGALGMKRVVTCLPPNGMMRPGLKTVAERAARKVLLAGLGEVRLFGRMGVGATDADAFIFLNQAERLYANYVYGWSSEKSHVIPEGVDNCFFNVPEPSDRLDGLLYPSYICPRKNQVEIARVAKRERIPVFFAGGAQGESPSYFESFKNALDDEYAIWLGDIADREQLAAMYKKTHGTFLASDYDNQGIILLESIAAGKPAMGPDLPALRSYFGDRIHYCPSAKSSRFPAALKKFDLFCRSGGKQTMDVLRWSDVGKQVLNVYKTVLDSSASLHGKEDFNH